MMAKTCLTTPTSALPPKWIMTNRCLVRMKDPKLIVNLPVVSDAVPSKVWGSFSWYFIIYCCALCLCGLSLALVFVIQYFPRSERVDRGRGHGDKRG